MIRDEQKDDEYLQTVSQYMEEKGSDDFRISKDDILRFKERICVLVKEKIRRQLMIETHMSSYSVHPGITKMYHDMRN